MPDRKLISGYLLGLQEDQDDDVENWYPINISHPLLGDDDFESLIRRAYHKWTHVPRDVQTND